MEVIGRVQWWDEKYGRGVIEDAKGNEYFFDRSVISSGPRQKIQRNKIVTFLLNKKVTHRMCAMQVEILTAKKQTAAVRRFEEQTQQSVAV